MHGSKAARLAPEPHGAFRAAPRKGSDMTQQNDETTPPRKGLGQGWKLVGLLAVTAGLAGVAGAGLANGQVMHAMHAMHGGMQSDPSAMEQHFDEMIGTILPDATPQQKARLKEIMQSAHADLHGLHSGLGEAHAQMLDLLARPTVDRAALEALRTGQVHQLDATSAHLVSSFADAAEVLTPAQRVTFVEHIKMQMH